MRNDDRRAPRAPLLWEQHCCLPLTEQGNVGDLARYRRPGGSYVSVNVGLLTVEGVLRDRGYPDEAVAAILGGNFRGVAAQVWR